MKILGLRLPRSLRIDFKTSRSLIYPRFPFEKLEGSQGVICVGDVVSTQCLNLKSVDNIFIIYDRSTRRGPFDIDIGSVAEAKKFKRIKLFNPPGTISFTTFYEICRILKGGGSWSIEIIGEEDMLALVAMQCAPIGYWVVFGIPGRGVACVKVNALSRLDSSIRTLELL